MNRDDVRDEVRPRCRSIAVDVATKPLEPRDVGPAAQQDLGVAVDDRSARSPQAVPDQEVVAGSRIVRARSLGPCPTGGQHVGDELGVEGERIVPVEDDDAVVGFGHRRVRARHDSRAADSPEYIGRRVGLGMAERATLGGLDLGRQVASRRREVERPSGAQGREDRRLQSGEVHDLHHRLLADRLDRTERPLQPGVHLGRRIGAALDDPHVEEAIGTHARFAGQAPEDVGELEQARQSASRLLARGMASHSSRSRLMTWTSSWCPPAKWACRSVPSIVNPAFSYARRPRALPA